MFGHFPELIIIVVIGLIIFGPEKLPEMAATAGKMVREVRATVDTALHPEDHQVPEDFSAYYYESMARSGEPVPEAREEDEDDEDEDDADDDLDDEIDEDDLEEEDWSIDAEDESWEADEDDFDDEEPVSVMPGDPEWNPVSAEAEPEEGDESVIDTPIPGDPSRASREE